MRDAVIVSTARTPIGKAYRGAFNATTPQALAGHAISHAVSRAGIDAAEVEDVILGAALQQGFIVHQHRASGRDPRGPARNRRGHVARPAMRVRHDGHCHRGQAGDHRRHADRRRRRRRIASAWCRRPTCALPPIRGSRRTSPTCTCRCWKPPKPSPRAMVSAATTRTTMPCDRNSAPPPPRPRAGSTTRSCRCSTVMKVQDRDTKAISDATITLDKDEGNRPSTTLEGLQSCSRCSRTAL